MSLCLRYSEIFLYSGEYKYKIKIYNVLSCFVLSFVKGHESNIFTVV